MTTMETPNSSLAADAASAVTAESGSSSSSSPSICSFVCSWSRCLPCIAGRSCCSNYVAGTGTGTGTGTGAGAAHRIFSLALKHSATTPGSAVVTMEAPEALQKDTGGQMPARPELSATPGTSSGTAPGKPKILSWIRLALTQQKLTQTGRRWRQPLHHLREPATTPSGNVRGNHRHQYPTILVT